MSCVFWYILAYTAVIIFLPRSVQSSVSIDQSLQWGPYRPNLYVGLRPKVGESLLLGLMWANDNDGETDARWRHTCEQDEGMAGYGWTNYDARLGGEHVVNDTEHKIDLISGFSKIDSESGHETWGLRVRGLLRKDAPPTQRTTVVFYIGSEEAGSQIMCDATVSDVQGTCQGTMSKVPNFSLRFSSTAKSEANSHNSMFVDSITVAPDTIWQAKRILEQEITARQGQSGMVPHAPGQGNLHLIQMRFEGEFEFEAIYRSKPLSDEWASGNLSESLRRAEHDFDRRFQSVYTPLSPFRHNDYTRFSKALVSNLMGGIGFFYGKSKVATLTPSDGVNIFETSAQAQSQGPIEETGPYQLLSAVPSRPFFPRGFLWDEGFHLLVIMDWDMDLALEIVESWLSLMDEDGWIAREQILGPEARSKVPEQFQTQHREYANPPTLFFVIEAFVARLKGAQAYTGVRSRYLSDTSQGQSLLRDIYPKLKKHYEWWRRTQLAELAAYQREDVIITEGYRWRGRTAQHVLTSGLDDYPRAQTASIQELHLDALCWVGVMAGVLEKIATTLVNKDDLQTYVKQRNAVMTSLEYLHWSDADGMFCDLTVSSTQTVEKVCHEGYLSLFPFFTGLMDPNHLDAVLKTIRDPGRLWSNHGLRSLSARDEFYGTGEDYWRSPVWININYLVLVKLQDYSLPQSPQRELIRETYSQLRLNLVNTVFQSWKDTGFAWEQYNDKTGKGQRTQYFTGWTALITRIMAMPGNEYDDRPSSRIRRPGQHSSWSYTFPVFVIVMLAVATLFRRRLMLMWLKVMKRW